MTVERMTELFLLHVYLSSVPRDAVSNPNTVFTVDSGERINLIKMYERFKELQSDFMKPYVISNASKED